MPYINTASTAGGNGTTNATTGADRAYASAAEWEAAEQTSLGANHSVLACGATDDAAVTIDGWTMNGFTLTFEGNSGDAAGAHEGKWDTAFYTVAGNVSTSGILVPVEENVTIKNIQVNNLNVDGIGIGQFSVIGNDLKILGIVLKGAGATGGGTGLGLQDLNNLRTHVKNCIVHDWPIGIYIRNGSTGANGSICSNCTFTQNGVGAQARGGGARAVNLLSFGNTADWGRTAGDWDAANSYYNAFGNSGTLVPGSTDIDLSAFAATDLYLDNANEDFHLLNSGSAYSSVDDNGVGPSSNSDVPADDIDGDTRSGTTTSVGADIVAAGGTTANSAGSATAVAKGSSTAQVPASSSGAATAVGKGASTATGVMSSAGVSTALSVGTSGSVETGVMSSAGSATALAVGISSATSIAVSIGTGSSVVVGSSANTGVAKSAGIGTSLVVGSSASSGIARSEGSGMATAVGEAISAGTGIAQSLGVATATARSTTTATGAMSSAGASTATAKAEDTSIIIKKFGPRGRAIAKKQKQKQLKIELQNIVSQDEDDLAVIKAAFTAALTEYLKLAA